MSSPKDRIVRVVHEVVGPMVRADGGEIYLVHAADDAVVLHLAGRFAGCPGNTLVKRRVIEPAILAVAPDALVTVTSGVIVPANATRVDANAG